MENSSKRIPVVPLIESLKAVADLQELLGRIPTMRKASQLFYLAVFSLLSTSHGATHISTKEPAKAESSALNVCDVGNSSDCQHHKTDYPKTVLQIEPGAIVSDACASYSLLEDLNEAIQPYVAVLTQKTDFFSHYRLNLYNKKCPFWSDENGMCGNIACAVNTLENEEDIPLVWRAKELGKLEGPTAHHPGRKEQEEHKEKPLKGELGEGVGESCVVEYDDECDERDYCIPEDERASSKGDYVSLVENRERFTGYSGAGAHHVWEAIYHENCFSTQKQADAPGFSGSSEWGGPFGAPNKAAQDIRSVMKEQAFQKEIKSAIAHNADTPLFDPLELDDQCIEKRVFYRVISGMHASISTHLCWDYLNQMNGAWGPNLTCYEQRLHNHPDRISNMYFNYALILRAVGKVREHIKQYQFCSADPAQDKRTRDLVLNLSYNIPDGPQIFDETIMFQDPSVADLKEDFRNRFRNVSRIMDCVGCDKCRLWGKVQTAGYGTALKILFEFDEKDSSKDPPLRRTELVALINTMDRLSHSLTAVSHFRRMIEERDGLEHTHSLASQRAKETVNLFGVDGKVPDFRRKRRQGATIGEQIADEVTIVFKAFKFVLQSWIELPGKV